MTTVSKFGRRWIWAVDAFHDHPGSQWKAVEALRALCGEAPVAVVPVAAVSIGQFDARVSRFLNTWRDASATAERNLEALLRLGKHAGLEEARLVKQENSALTFAADSVIRFALEQNAEGITLTSHGRKGPGRLILGSFAETLLLRSPLPVLIVNPKSEKPGRVDNILYPTDFSEASREGFSRTLGVACRLKARITLFHKMNSLYPEVGNGTARTAESGGMLSAVEAELREKAAAWIEEARANGVKVSLQFDLKPGRVSPSVTKAVARQGKNAVVAMSSTSGPVRAMLLGSVARQVVRGSSKPVLIFHAGQESLVRSFLAEAGRAAKALTANPPLI